MTDLNDVEQLQKELETARTYILKLTKSEKALRESRQRLETLERRYIATLDALLEGYILISHDWRYIFVNEAAAEQGNTTKEHLMGRPVLEASSGIKNSPAFAKLKECMETRKPQHLITDFILPDKTKRVFKLVIEPIPEGISVLALNITELKEVETLVSQREAEVLRKSNIKLQKAMNDLIQTISRTCELRDPYTAGHESRVTQLALAIAKELKLDTDKTEGLRIAAAIHDIGKMNIPAEILSKAGKLSETELTMVKIHVQTGFEIIRTIDFAWPVADIVLQHHERLNGSGYPLGVTNNNILIEAKILAVADVVEAMSSHRPYRPALGIEKALEEITVNKGILYDSSVVDACLRIFNEKVFEFKEDKVF